MNKTRRKYLLRALAAFCIASVIGGALGWRLYLPLFLRVTFADDQTHIFEEMRSQALAGEAAEAARCLQYAVAYYLSGTRQVQASLLDRIVERSRAQTTSDIIAHLRAKTGNELGPTPERWIQQYATQP